MLPFNSTYCDGSIVFWVSRMPVRRYIFYATVGLLSFILTILLLLGRFDSAVVARDSVLYGKAQKAQSDFLVILENLVISNSDNCPHLSPCLWPPIEVGKPANQLVLFKQGLTSASNNLL